MKSRMNGYVTKLIYEDNTEFYGIQEWLNEHTIGKVKIRSGYTHALTIVTKRIHIVHFEKEDDATFCKLKFPPYKA